MRLAGALASETSALESQATAAETVRQRSQQRMAELDGQFGQLMAELEQLRRRRDELTAGADEQDGLLTAAKQQLAESQQRTCLASKRLGRPAAAS